jgi:hypothetical protein
LFDYIVTSFFVGIEICVQKIGEEEYFQDNKYYDQLNKNDHPEFFTNGHAPETLIVKLKDLFYHFVICVCKAI